MKRKVPPKTKLQSSFRFNDKFYYMFDNGFAYEFNGIKAKRITKERFLNKRAERYNY